MRPSDAGERRVKKRLLAHDGSENIARSGHKTVVGV
jgi:hypothetical protein